MNNLVVDEQWFAIPADLLKAVPPPTTGRLCWACLKRALPPHHAEPGVALFRRQGYPAKILIETLARWKSPDLTRGGSELTQWFESAAVRLTAADLVRAFIPDARNGEMLPNDWERQAIRRALRTLERGGFVVRETAGRALALVPHHDTAANSLSIPSGIRHNGWLRDLDGGELLMLLRTYAAIGGVSRFHEGRRRRARVRLEDRGRLVVERLMLVGSKNLPVSRDTAVDALNGLVKRGLLQPVRAYHRDLLYMADPLLEGSP